MPTKLCDPHYPLTVPLSRPYESIVDLPYRRPHLPDSGQREAGLRHGVPATGDPRNCFPMALDSGNGTVRW